MSILIRRLSRLLLSLFYRRVRVVGAEGIPAVGPIIVCPNHHGSLIDPMVALAITNRPLRPLAKAPLFLNPLLRPFLNAVGAVPVHRPQDRHIVSGSNSGLYRATAEALGRGEALLIFPEGLSKAHPTLSPLRPGAARMALEAEAMNHWSAGVTLIPVAIHFEDGGGYRRGQVTVEVGEPLSAVPHRATYSSQPEVAIAALTADLTQSLRRLLVESETGADLRLLRTAMRAWSHERGERIDAAAEIALARDFKRAQEALSRETPTALQPLRLKAESYAHELETFGFSGHELDVAYRPLSILRFLAVEIATFAVLGPLGLVGVLIHWLPFRIAALLAARLSEEADSWASLQLGVALVTFPAFWLVAAIAIAALISPWAGLAALLLLPTAGLIGWRFVDRQARFRRSVRSFLLLAGSGLKRHLRAGRREIHDEVERLRATHLREGDPLE